MIGCFTSYCIEDLLNLPATRRWEFWSIKESSFSREIAFGTDFLLDKHFSYIFGQVFMSSKL